MSIQHVYEKWKHLDHLLSIDPSFSSMTSWKDELNHDLWQAVKAEAEQEEIDLYSAFLAWRGIDPAEVCPECSGAGSRAYANTTAWRGGIGGQTVTGGICDHCWGSGNAVHPWTNLRRLEAPCPPAT